MVKIVPLTLFAEEVIHGLIVLMNGMKDGISFIFVGLILQQWDIKFQMDALTFQIEELVCDGF